MPLANTKRVQTLVNLCAEAAIDLDVIADRLNHYRALYVAANIDPTGTVLEGKVMAVSAWIDKVLAVANDPVCAGLIAARVPTHRNQALEG